MAIIANNYRWHIVIPLGREMSDFDQYSRQPRKKSGMGRLAELGPAWISALAALLAALAAAGFFAGRVSASAGPSAAPTAQPTVVVTKTMTASPLAVTGGASPSTPSTPSTANTEGNGTELGAYSFRLTNGYSAPLAASAPTQGQITETSASYDIDFNGQIYPGSNERMISLASGSSPTYSACTSGTVFENTAPADTGTAFCIVETSGRVAGITVASVNSSPSYLVLKVTSWQDVS